MSWYARGGSRSAFARSYPKCSESLNRVYHIMGLVASISVHHSRKGRQQDVCLLSSPTSCSGVGASLNDHARQVALLHIVKYAKRYFRSHISDVACSRRVRQAFLYVLPVLLETEALTTPIFQGLDRMDNLRKVHS